MSLRGNIFVKIFVGFWLVTLAILGSWLLTDQYFDSRPGSEHARHDKKGPPHRFMLRIIYEMQNLDDTELRAMLDRTRKQHELDIYVLDRLGNDLFERPVPERVEQLADKLRGGRRR